VRGRAGSGSAPPILAELVLPLPRLPFVPQSSAEGEREFAHSILWTTLAAFADLCAVLAVELEIDCAAELKEAGDALEQLVNES
jgi:hypothetical protein